MTFRASGLTFLLLAAAASLSAQAPQRPQLPLPGQDLGGRGTLTVRVRDVRGVPLRVHASVRVYSNFTSVNVFQPARGSGEAVFPDLPLGNYIVEVNALGYLTSEEEVTLFGDFTLAVINLKPESDAETLPAPAKEVSAPGSLPRKAQKEVEKTLEALEKNDLKEARKRVEQALKHAPEHPDVNYLAGMVSVRLRDWERARTYLEKAAQLDPGHARALVSLGGVRLSLRDFAGAIEALDRALALEPHSWQGHGLIAQACYLGGEFERARAHAQRALELGGDKAPELRLLLVQAWSKLGEWDEAIAESEAFLRHHPGHPLAGAAQNLRARARQHQAAATADDRKSGNTEPAVLPSVPLADLAPALPARVWAPLEVDREVPPVATDMPCRLPGTLAGAGRRAAELVENLQRFTARERVEWARVDEQGDVGPSDEREFNYLVLIHSNRLGGLTVQELRDGPMGLESQRTYATGLAAMALIFHPQYVEDFEMQCEGLGQQRGQAAWQVYFRQQADRPARVLRYRGKRGAFSVPLKGRAWIAASTYQILRLELDVVEPIAEIALERQHLAIDYQPVAFARRGLKLWLPQQAELFLQVRGQRSHHRHSFSDYRLFAVDMDERVQDLRHP